MIDVSNEVKQAYENSTTQIDKIILDKQEYRITNVEYYDDCYDEGNVFGTAIAKILEFEIENLVDLEGKEFEYLTGIKIGETINWISLGNFIVQDIEPNDTTNINKVTAMDYMLKSNIEYRTELDYNSGEITILDVIQEACIQAGIELATMDFANCNFMVDSNQFVEGTLNRQVIQAVAQISGTIAKIRSDNKLYLITPKTKGLLVKDVHIMTVAELNLLPVEKLSGTENKYSMSNYKELVIKRNTHPINLVSLGMADVEGENIVLRDETSIKENGENSLVINDNPFAYTQEKREQLITALFDIVKGFKYTSFEIQGQSKPYIETGDEVLVIDKEGNVFSSFLFRFNYKSPNGLESEMSAPSITRTTVNYQNVPSALDIAKRTEIVVNKELSKITATVQKNEKQLLKDINNNYQDIIQKLDDKAQKTDVISLETAVETIQTNTNYAIKISEDIQANGVSKVKTETGYTFDEEGLTIEKTNAKTKSTLNESGLEVKDSTGSQDEDLLKAGYDKEIGETVVKSKNMNVEKYLTIGKYSRIEDYEEGTGVFWIGG